MTANQTMLKLVPREPSRANGKQRYEHLLDVAADLLAETPPAPMTIEAIAKRAQVTTGSAYHFFPSVEALYVALARRYVRSFIELAERPVSLNPADNWQTQMRAGFEAGRDFYHANPAALRLFLSLEIPEAVRRQDLALNQELGKIMVRNLQAQFSVTEIPGLAERCENAIDISDRFWSKSYDRHGNISDDAFEEAFLAATAYLRCFLPEILAPLR